MSRNDKAIKEEVYGSMYLIKCEGHTDHPRSDSYLGETEWTLNAKFVEHRRPSNTTSKVARPIHDRSLESDAHICTLCFDFRRRKKYVLYLYTIYYLIYMTTYIIYLFCDSVCILIFSIIYKKYMDILRFL